MPYRCLEQEGDFWYNEAGYRRWTCVHGEIAFMGERGKQALDEMEYARDS